MKISVVSPADISAELADYLSATQDTSHLLEAWAVRHHVLPLMGDIMGCWALTTSAELVFFSWDQPEQLDIVEGLAHEKALLNAALAHGSRRYPRLSAMLPSRPQDAVTCTTCDGSGKIPNVPENVVCLCAGLGWLPASAVQPLSRKLGPA